MYKQRNVLFYIGNLLLKTSPSRLRRATSPIEGRPWHTGKFCIYPESFPLRQRLPYKGSWRGACDETERLYEGQPARAPPQTPAEGFFFPSDMLYYNVF